MLKVLIADDEINICRLIKNIVDWDTLNLEIIGMANNGLEAYDIIIEKSPDIVITDIKMPALDGLELLKKVHDYGHKTRFIIISGYKHFDYAYSAIKYGVEDYLLKPINKNELTETLEKLIAEINGSNQHDKNIAQIEKKITLSVKRLRKEFILNLLYESISYGELSIERINNEYHYKFQEGYYKTGIIHLDQTASSDGIIKKILPKLSKKLIEELKLKCTEVEVIEKDNEIIFIANYPVEKSNVVSRSIKYAFETMSEIIKPYGFLSLTVGLGTEHNELHNISKSLKTAAKAIKSRIILGSNIIIDATLLDLSFNNLENFIVPELIAPLYRSIETLDKVENIKLTKKSFVENLPILKQYPYIVLDWAKYLINSFLKELNKKTPINGGTSIIKKNIYSKIDECITLNEITQCILSSIEEVFDSIYSNKGEQSIKTITIAKQYILKNYSKHLELDDIASQVYLNPAYFGILFKRETGTNFSDYLIKVRIDAAKELLKDVKYNISQISNLVGYKDTRYFSKLFKKNIGVKPTEYRKLHQFGIK